jgi:hypothetical protein
VDRRYNRKEAPLGVSNTDPKTEANWVSYFVQPCTRRANEAKRANDGIYPSQSLRRSLTFAGWLWGTLVKLLPTVSNSYR